MVRWVFAAGALLLAAPATAQVEGNAAAAPDYSDEARWLCLPDRQDSCGKPLPVTALNANGYGSVGQAVPARDPNADCFYVYPTVSRDPGANSDLQAGPEEEWTAQAQFARFAGVCRTFAPIYRQATLAALMGAMAGAGGAERAMALAYQDVASAWRHYLRHYNQGRPFVLVGHSQGAVHLTGLLAREIENAPEAGRMLSALLIGSNVEVPEGKRVGGTFAKTPLCARLGERGCVVSYVSFRASNPPPASAAFGRSAKPGMTVACTNPARLRRETTPLDSYWPTGRSLTGGPDEIVWSSSGPPPTPFVRTEGLVSAACVSRGNSGYLSVLVNADPSDARTDRIPGDVRVGGNLLAGWGLHPADMALALGDLVQLVEAQVDGMPPPSP